MSRSATTLPGLFLSRKPLRERARGEALPVDADAVPGVERVEHLLDEGWIDREVQRAAAFGFGRCHSAGSSGAVTGAEAGTVKQRPRARPRAGPATLARAGDYAAASRQRLARARRRARRSGRRGRCRRRGLRRSRRAGGCARHRSRPCHRRQRPPPQPDGADARQHAAAQKESTAVTICSSLESCSMD